MCAAFIPPTPLWSGAPSSRSLYRSFTSPRRRHALVPSPPKRVGMLQMVEKCDGWAETRLNIGNETPIMAEAPKPGVYFTDPPRMTIEDLLKIIRAESPDEWVNEIVRTFLGWRQLDNGEWNDDLVEPRWKKVYKNGPPDFIGKAGDYTPEKDRPVKIAIQNLSRSVPAEGKQLLKPTLKPHGFSGWKVHQLTPNLTRRAQAVNFILYWYKSHYPDYQWT